MRFLWILLVVLVSACDRSGSTWEQDYEARALLSRAFEAKKRVYTFNETTKLGIDLAGTIDELRQPSHPSGLLGTRRTDVTERHKGKFLRRTIPDDTGTFDWVDVLYALDSRKIATVRFVKVDAGALFLLPLKEKLENLYGVRLTQSDLKLPRQRSRYTQQFLPDADWAKACAADIVDQLETLRLSPEEAETRIFAGTLRPPYLCAETLSLVELAMSLSAGDTLIAGTLPQSVTLTYTTREWSSAIERFDESASLRYKAIQDSKKAAQDAKRAAHEKALKDADL